MAKQAILIMELQIFTMADFDTSSSFSLSGHSTLPQDMVMWKIFQQKCEKIVAKSLFSFFNEYEENGSHMS